MSDRILFKIYRGIGVALLLFFVAVIVIFLSGYYVFTHRSLPQTEGDISVSGLSVPVTVIRDEWGVPHIFATDPASLFFASGFVQAQDRLFQMDLLRRVSEGRLAEWVGEEAVESDRFARVMGFHRQAQKNLAQAPAETRRLLDAFTAGINEAIRRQGKNVPLEYQALREKVEVWRPEDTLAVALYIGWGLTMNWQIELVRLALHEERGEEAMWEIVPLYDGRGPNILPPEAWPGHTVGAAEGGVRTAARGPRPPTAGEDEAAAVSALLAADRKLREVIGPGLIPQASNSWVVDGTLSRSGKPLLANDPHLQLGLPSVWYELHLSLPGLDVIGVTFPGIPVVVLGHNRKIAWAATTTFADMDDLFQEELNPADDKEYKFQGQWVPVEQIPEKIVVKTKGGGRRVETLLVRLTRHGPVINDILQPPLKLKNTLSLCWTGFQTLDQLGAFWEVNRAEDWESFREGIQRLGCPVQNWLFADAAGNIGYIAAGLYPRRAAGRGDFPADGASGNDEWQGFRALEQLPQVKNPSTHYLVTANNQVWPAERAAWRITGNYGPPYRSQRIVSLLTNEKEKFTARKMQTLQMDVLSLRAVRLLPVFLSVLERHRALDHDLERAYRQLQEWEGTMKPELAAPALFEETYNQALILTYQDEMSRELFKWLLGLELIEYAFDNLLEKGTSRLFDDRRTPAVESRDDILLAALGKAITSLSRRAGDRMTTWQWGKLHELRLSHPLGQAPPLRKAADILHINLPPVPFGGSRNTVNNGFYLFGEGYAVQVGASMRHVIDFGDVENATLSYPGGQSGHPFSPHYADLLPLWLKGEGHPLLLSRPAIEKRKRSELRLQPG